MVDTYQGRLDGRQRNRLKGLLDMMYRPSELADYVGFPVNHVYRVYLPLGCPHERDSQRHIWIHGETFVNWYIETYKKTKSPAGYAHCRTCKQNVKYENPTREETEEGLIYEVGFCPNCGRKTVRIITQK